MDVLNSGIEANNAQPTCDVALIHSTSPGKDLEVEVTAVVVVNLMTLCGSRTWNYSADTGVSAHENAEIVAFCVRWPFSTTTGCIPQLFLATPLADIVRVEEFEVLFC